MPDLWPSVVGPPGRMVCPSPISLRWHHPQPWPRPGLGLCFSPQFPGKTAISLHIPSKFHVEPPGQGPFLVQWLMSLACQWLECFHHRMICHHNKLFWWTSSECHTVEVP